MTKGESIQEMLEQASGHRDAGRLEQAEQLYRQVLAADPNHVQAMHLLGMLQFRQNQVQASAELLSRASALEPGNANILVDLGNAFLVTGRLEPAIAAFQKAISLNPDHIAAMQNLAIAFQYAERRKEAIEIYRQILTKKPDDPSILSSLGNALLTCARAEEALPILRRLVELRPEDADAYNSVAATLLILVRPGEAIAACQRAIRLRPDYADAYKRLGNALRDSGQILEGIAAYRQAFALRPDLASLHSSLVYGLYFHPESSAQAILKEHTEWDGRHAAPLARFIPPHRNDRSAYRRLRIGYVSGDLRNHVVGFNLLPMFRHHNHNQFHIVCYSGVTQADQTTDIFRSLSDEWRPIVERDDAEIATMVVRDQIDILVDLSLHMDRNWLLVFARKPAPIQVTFAGYPGTTGLKAIDYRLTDPYLDPPGMNEAFYSEKSIRLPHSFWCYAPTGTEPEVNSLPAIESGYIAFGCLNTFGKVNETVLRLWDLVLQAIPKSKLLLLAPPGEVRQWVLSKLRTETGRVQFLDRASRYDYLKLYHQIDISLDSFPYNGHTTGLDSWWMGVPVITLCGQTVVSRAGFSQASNLGMTELVAYSPDQFVQIAKELANDLPRLSELRATLRSRMAASPLMDAAGFADGIETAYRQMWRVWRQSRK